MTQILILALLLAYGEARNEGERRPCEIGINEVLSRPARSPGLRDPKYRWAGNTIPYKITTDDLNFANTFLSATKYIEGRTCIRFKERSLESDYIFVEKDPLRRCFTNGTGRQGGLQLVMLGSGCMGDRIEAHLHELMHILGFGHEQQRTDRDEFVTINWKHVPNNTDIQYAFKEVDGVEASPFGVPYDYQSIMQYGDKQASSGGKYDIITPLDRDANISQILKKFSPYDIMKINNMYCHGTIGFRIQNVANEALHLTIKPMNETTWKVETLEWANEENQKFTVDWFALQNQSKRSYIVPWQQNSANVISLGDPGNSLLLAYGEDAKRANQLWWVERLQYAEDSRWQIKNEGSSKCISKGQDTDIPEAVMTACDETHPEQLWKMFRV